jgi:hypothetical protein
MICFDVRIVYVIGALLIGFALGLWWKRETPKDGGL